MVEAPAFHLDRVWVCGKASLEALYLCGCALPVSKPGAWLTPELVSLLPEYVRVAQRVFQSTRGLHAAALFSRTAELLAVRDDARAARSCRSAWPPVSQSFARSPRPARCGLASAKNSAWLIDFLREERFNIHAGPERLAVFAHPPEFASACCAQSQAADGNQHLSQKRTFLHSSSCGPRIAEERGC